MNNKSVKIVPEWPTNEQCCEGQDRRDRNTSTEFIYRGMMAAAPPYPPLTDAEIEGMFIVCHEERWSPREVYTAAIHAYEARLGVK